MTILNPWPESNHECRLYLNDYTVAGEKQADVYVMPWPRQERRQAIQYASAIRELGMASGYFLIESTSH